MNTLTALRVPASRSCSQQIRHASLLRRPRRPYTFTQLITLSDGSTFLHRTTSPAPIHKSTKDTKNSPMWNPSSQKLLNVEEDEAGRLRRFRKRFGRGFDVEGDDAEKEPVDGQEVSEDQSGEESLMDMISSFGQQADAKTKGDAASATIEEPKKAIKGKSGKK